MPKAAKAKKEKKEKKSSTSSGGISKGDLILIETEMRLKENDALIDTTNRELAEKENIYSENQPYGPQLVSVGDNMILPKIDTDLENLSVGDEKVYEIDPAEAFGIKDPANIRTYSIREFKKAGIDVRKNLGKRIDFKGKKALLLGERGGRVKVDFNHPLAGNSLNFKVNIVKKLETNDEIIDHIFSMFFRGLPTDKIEKDIDESTNTLRLSLPTEALLIQGIQRAKFGAAQFLMKKLSYDNLEFIEKFSREFFEPKAPPAPASAEKTADPEEKSE